MPIERVNFDLREVAGQAVEFCRAAARAKKLRLSVRFGRNVPRLVKGDPARTRQILLNFVSNAVKFTEKGTVSLRARMTDGPASRLRHFAHCNTHSPIIPLFLPLFCSFNST